MRKTMETGTASLDATNYTTLQAAADLYGSGSAQYNGVAAAWSAVGVN